MVSAYCAGVGCLCFKNASHFWAIYPNNRIKGTTAFGFAKRGLCDSKTSRRSEQMQKFTSRAVHSKFLVLFGLLLVALLVQVVITCSFDRGLSKRDRFKIEETNKNTQKCLNLPLRRRHHFGQDCYRCHHLSPSSTFCLSSSSSACRSSRCHRHPYLSISICLSSSIGPSSTCLSYLSSSSFCHPCPSITCRRNKTNFTHIYNMCCETWQLTHKYTSLQYDGHALQFFCAQKCTVSVRYTDLAMECSSRAPYRVYFIRMKIKHHAEVLHTHTPSFLQPIWHF